jgi:hypothetical protein
MTQSAVLCTDRYQLNHVSDEALHTGVKTLVGRHNVITAELLAHLAEVEARGIYRERACSSLYTYCIYELRLSEDEAQRRAKAVRTAREFPALFEMLAEGAIHMTGLLLLAPCLTAENQAELLARARFRTKREIERLVAEVAPRPDVPARIEPLGPRRATVTNIWQAYTTSLCGPVRELSSGTARGQVPAPVFDELERGEFAEPSEPDDGCGSLESPAPARVGTRASPARVDAPSSKPLVPLRYRVEFTASQEYVERLEEARNLLQHQVPDRDVARIHELAMAVFVQHLRKRRQAAVTRTRRGAASVEPAPPERVTEAPGEAAPERVTECASGEAAPERVPQRHVPAATRRAVWERDVGRCTFADSSGRRCCERAGLEIHHEDAYALGGASTVENLRLLCRAHNALLAERDFGRAYVERMRRDVQRGNGGPVA